MNPIIIFILGIIIGFAIAWIIKKPKPELSEKESGKQKIINHLKATGKITNNQVEELLGCGNTTAYRYLEELEQAGKIEQIGKTGRSVEYRLK